MKKLLLTVGIIVFACNASFAQSKIKLGFNAAATVSSFRGNSQIETLDAGFDFMAGISFEYQLKERLSLLVNVNYDRKTATDKPYVEIIENPDDPGFYGKIKIKYTNQFVSVPVLLKYKFGPGNGLYINGGPFIGFLLKSELTNSYDNTSSDQTDNLKTFDFGLSFGFGKTFKLKNGNGISVEIRENLGLTDISDVPIVDNGSIKTNSLNLICNYSFDLK